MGKIKTNRLHSYSIKINHIEIKGIELDNGQ